jgi:ATP-dependent Clp protease ATP-binding subunit ClpB
MVRTNKKLDPTQTGNDAAKLRSSLQKLVVGQEEPISQIVNIYQTWSAGMTDPNRPIGSFLFLGPTGTGKTRLVEATAEALVGDPRAVLKIDCGEFQQSHEIAKLIGSPPGYLGHRETHAALSQEALNHHHTESTRISFVLFDEIEKASDAVWNLLLGILDKATLTLGDNRKVDFSRCMIFMTSNIGAADMEAMVRPKLGFTASDICTPNEALTGKISRAGMEAMRRKFSPEFVNRIDKVAVFRQLGSAELDSVLTIELHRLQNRILTSQHAAPFVFSVGDEARTYLLREGTDIKYGARHLKRAIERSLVHPLSNLIASSQIDSGDLVRVEYDELADCLIFVKEAEAIAGWTMARMIDRPAELRAAAGAHADAKWPPRVSNAKKERSRRV